MTVLLTAHHQRCPCQTGHQQLCCSGNSESKAIKVAAFSYWTAVLASAFLCQEAAKLELLPGPLHRTQTAALWVLLALSCCPRVGQEHLSHLGCS